MRLESFNVGYSSEEDRILFQAVGDEGTHNFWITRRAALMVGEGLQRALAEQRIKFGDKQIPTSFVEEILAFDHEHAIKANPPKPGTLRSDLNNGVLLLFQISYAAEDEQHCIIQMMDQHQQGYAYRLTREMLHAILNLIQSQCDQAGWGIHLLQADQGAVTADRLKVFH